MFKRKNRTQLGINIEENQLYIVALEHAKKTFRLKSWSIFQNEKKHAATTIIKNAGTPKAVFTIPASITLMQTLQLPIALQNQDIINYLATNAIEHFGYAFDQLYLDFIRTDTQVRIIAAKRIEIDKRLQELHQYGFQIIAVDTELLAIERIVNQHVFKLKNQCVVAVYISKSTLLFTVLEQGYTIYSRNEANIPLVAALQRFIQFFNATHTNKNLDAVLLLNSAITDDSIQAISQGLNIPCHTYDLFSAINYPIKAESLPKTELTLALATAMWKPDYGY